MELLNVFSLFEFTIFGPGQLLAKLFRQDHEDEMVAGAFGLAFWLVVFVSIALVQRR